MSLYDVYIPTYKRAGEVKTHELFPEAHLVCPESQAEEYREAYPNMSIVPCPDSVEGNMAKKRNWIKNYAEARNRYYVMIDDDIKRFQMLEGNRQLTMSKEQIDHMIINGFQMAEDLGTILWGINVNTDPKCYMAYTPFNMLSVILGPFTAHIKNPLRYDEMLPTKEDYDYALKVLHKYHKVLRFNKYSYDAGHIENQKGGSITIRRWEMEEAQNEMLQERWGKKVIKYNMQKSINPRVIVPLSGV